MDYLFNSGIDCYSLGQFENAIKYFDRVIELDPSNQIAVLDKGNVLFRLKKYNEASECYDKALSISDQHSTDYSDSWLGKGNILYELEREQEALECYEKSIELHPESIDSWIGKLRVLAMFLRVDEMLTTATNLREVLLHGGSYFRRTFR